MGEAFLRRAKGVLWRKYSTTCTYYYPEDSIEMTPGTLKILDLSGTGESQVAVYGELYFDTDQGFYTNGDSAWVPIKDLENTVYECRPTEATQIVVSDGFPPVDSDGYYLFDTIVHTCEEVITYTKTNTLLDTVISPLGALPESGTLIEGSADGDYCIVSTSSGTYYYERMGR